MRLDTGAWFVVLKVGQDARLWGTDGKTPGPEQVVLFNPKVPAANLFPIEKEKFRAHWTGEVVFLKRPYKLATKKTGSSACPGSRRNSGASARCCAMW